MLLIYYIGVRAVFENVTSDDFTICDFRAQDIWIWQINSTTFLRWQKMDKFIFKCKRIAVTKLHFVCWFVSFDSLDCEKMVM